MAEPIVISNFKTGLAQSPLEGFADMRNVILDGVSGFPEISWKAVRVASTAIGDEIMGLDRGNDFSSGATGTARGFFAVSRGGEVLYSSNGDTWTEIANTGDS